MNKYKIFVFTVSFFVFLSTVPPHYSWGHNLQSGLLGGELLSAVYGEKVPLSTGFSFYLFLAKIFSFLPFGEPAFELNMFSAIISSLTVVLIYLICLKVTENKPLSAITALTFPFSKIFWGHSNVASFEPLEGLLTGAAAFFFLDWLQKEKESSAYLTLLASTLLISTYVRDLVIIAPLFFFLWLSTRGKKKLSLGKIGLFFGMGLAPFLYLLFLKSNPANEFPTYLINSNLFGYLMGERYTWLWHPQPLTKVFENSMQQITIITQNLTLPSIIAILIGGYHLWEKRMRPYLLFILISVLNIILYKARFNSPGDLTFFLPMLILLSPLFSSGLLVVLELINSYLEENKEKLRLIIYKQEKTHFLPEITLDAKDSIILGTILLFSLLPLYLLNQNYSEMNLRHDKKALETAKKFDKALTLVTKEDQKRKIVLIPGDDIGFFTAKYVLYVKNKREDVIFVEGNDFYTKEALKKIFQKIYPMLEFPEAPFAVDKAGFNSLLKFMAANLKNYDIYYTFEYPYPNFSLTLIIDTDVLKFTSTGPLFRAEAKSVEN